MGGREGKVVCFLVIAEAKIVAARCGRIAQKGSPIKATLRLHRPPLFVLRFCSLPPTVLPLLLFSLSPTCFFLQPIRELRKANATSCAQKGEKRTGIGLTMPFALADRRRYLRKLGGKRGCGLSETTANKRQFFLRSVGLLRPHNMREEQRGQCIMRTMMRHE